MFKRIFSAALVLGAAALAPPAHAQAIPCMPRTQLVDALAEKHNEVIVATGLQSSKSLIEVWSSPQSGSFTILVTNASGLSCVVAVGQNWTSYAPPSRMAS